MRYFGRRLTPRLNDEYDENEIPTTAEWDLFLEWNDRLFERDLTGLREKVGEVADKPKKHQFEYLWNNGLIK